MQFSLFGSNVFLVKQLMQNVILYLYIYTNYPHSLINSPHNFNQRNLTKSKSKSKSCFSLIKCVTFVQVCLFLFMWDLFFKNFKFLLPVVNPIYEILWKSQSTK